MKILRPLIFILIQLSEMHRTRRVKSRRVLSLQFKTLFASVNKAGMIYLYYAKLPFTCGLHFDQRQTIIVVTIQS